MTITHYECLEAVSRPGKFQGQAPYVPYYWEMYLDGCADGYDGTVVWFTVTDEDRQRFPSLIGRHTVRLYEDDDGFVEEVLR